MIWTLYTQVLVDYQKGQEEIIYVVYENISVINITRVEMSENRQALNKIIGSLANLDV